MTVIGQDEHVAKLRRDIRDAAAELSDREARYLVDAYYAIQNHRIETQAQVRTLAENEEPNAVLGWLFDQHEVLEREIVKALDTFTDRHVAGRWAKSITGVGPVLSAGLLAHIDIEQAPTVGHIWRFAGLDPSVTWGRGEKRPWNADLKVLCWKIGESFVKVSGNDKDVYGKLYLVRKDREVAKNDAGEFADQAARALEERKYDKTTDAYAAYSKGKLPRARIHARAKRYAVKLFLAHFHHVLYESTFGTPPPMPYSMEHQGHAHLISPPNWPRQND